MEPPNWTNLKRLPPPSEILILPHTSSEKQYIRNCIAIPPFLVDTVKFLSTMQEKYLLIHFLAEKNSSTYKGKGVFTKAEYQCREVIKFPWESSHGTKEEKNTLTTKIHLCLSGHQNHIKITLMRHLLHPVTTIL